jgi:hypothetical protein
MSADTWLALSMYFPETDPVCGPGVYRLATVTLALSLNAALPGGAFSIAVLLYPSANGTGIPLTATASFMSAAIVSVGPVVASPSYLTLSLPSSWRRVYSSDMNANLLDALAAHTSSQGTSMVTLLVAATKSLT